MPKTVSLSDFLTEAEIRKAVRLYRQHGPSGALNKVLTEEIISPNITRINKALGQENDPRYLAYAIEYAIVSQGLVK